MLRKLSPEADQVVNRAKKIALDYQNEYVGTEHLLLALAQADAGVVRTTLDEQELDVAALRAEVDKLVPQNPEDTWVLGDLPGTPHLRNTVVRALDQAEKLHSDVVEPEHLLLALLAEEGSVAHIVLNACGVDVARVRKHLADSVREARKRQS